jgi:peptidylprolyl isomerase
MEKWSVIEIEYIGKVDNRVFDFATRKKVEGFENLKEKAESKIIILGYTPIIRGLEKVLLEMKPNEERELDIEAEDGFGIRKRELIKILPLSEFKKKGIDAVKDSLISLNGALGRILSISAGRVLVDFNHPLAGKKLHYKIKVCREVVDRDEKAKEIMKVLFGDKIKYELRNKELYIGEIDSNSLKELKKVFEKCLPEITIVVKKAID